jgi:hypothetical protein
VLYPIYKTQIIQMRFFHVRSHKVVFGITPKAGSTHVKYIIHYLLTGLRNAHPHEIYNDDFALDVTSNEDFRDHTLILFLRDPYARFVSAVLDKYKPGGEFRHLWDLYHTEAPTVYSILRDVSTREPSIDINHFAPQYDTDTVIMCRQFPHNYIFHFDIARIDYIKVAKLFNNPIDNADEWNKVIVHKWGHEHSHCTFVTDVLCMTPIDELDKNVGFEVKQFYDSKMKLLFTSVYEDDVKYYASTLSIA